MLRWLLFLLYCILVQLFWWFLLSCESIFNWLHPPNVSKCCCFGVFLHVYLVKWRNKQCWYLLTFSFITPLMFRWKQSFYSCLADGGLTLLYSRDGKKIKIKSTLRGIQKPSAFLPQLQQQCRRSSLGQSRTILSVWRFTSNHHRTLCSWTSYFSSWIWDKITHTPHGKVTVIISSLGLNKGCLGA